MSAAEEAHWADFERRRTLDAELERVQTETRGNTIERRRIIAEGRPEHYRRRKLGGIFGVLGGGAVLGFPIVVGLALLTGHLIGYTNLAGPDDEAGEPDGPLLPVGEKVAVFTALPIGLATIGVSIWALVTANRPNTSRDLPQLKALEAEHRALQMQLRELRQQ